MPAYDASPCLQSRRGLLRGVLAASIAGPGPALAESYPSKPIRVVLPGPAGGVIDIAIRAISDALVADLGQQVIVDPRPGGNGIMAGQVVVGSPSDGYTLELTVSAQLVFPHLIKVPFDVVADFTPIAMVGIATSIICVSKELPVATLPELIEYARKHPGELNYLNPASGTPAHLIIEQLKLANKLDIASVPYKGLPPGVQDLIGQRIQVGIISAPIVLQHVKSGAVKAIAVVGPRRIAELPDVATMSEQGFGGAELQSALPLFGPKRLPDTIVERLNTAVQRALTKEQVKARLASTFIEPMIMSVNEMRAWVPAEYKRYGDLIAQIGIKADSD